MSNYDTIVDFINNSPKTELHLHIEGSLEPELMFKLSKRNKIEIPFKSAFLDQKIKDERIKKINQ